MPAPRFKTKNQPWSHPTATRKAVRGGEVKTPLILSLVSLCALFVVSLDGRHLVLKSITLALYFPYCLVLMNRLLTPYFKDQRAIFEASVKMAGSAACDQNPPHPVTGDYYDSKLIVYCFRTKKRIPMKGDQK